MSELDGATLPVRAELNIQREKAVSDNDLASFTMVHFQVFKDTVKARCAFIRHLRSLFLAKWEGIIETKSSWAFLDALVFFWLSEPLLYAHSQVEQKSQQSIHHHSFFCVKMYTFNDIDNRLPEKKKMLLCSRQSREREWRREKITERTSADERKHVLSLIVAAKRQLREEKTVSFPPVLERIRHTPASIYCLLKLSRASLRNKN